MLESSLTHIFQSASQDGDLLNQLFFWFLIAAGLVLVSVISIVIYISLTFNAAKRPQIPDHKHSNRKTETLLTAIASVVVLLFLFLAIQTMWKIQTPPAPEQEADLVITGHQWWWEIYYPQTGAVAANEVHIPAGKRLLVKLESADVIHDWWVPALGRKMDMIPGHPNFVWMEAREPGTYEGMCSEFCGAQHAWMRVQVVAHTSTEFSLWEQAQLMTVQAPTDSLLLKGAQLFKEKTCSNCHTVKGWVEEASIGPDLTHIASRMKILGGKEINSLEKMKNWIANPQKLKPGAHMPNFILDQYEIDAIASWLYSLR